MDGSERVLGYYAMLKFTSVINDYSSRVLINSKIISFEWKVYSWEVKNRTVNVCLTFYCNIDWYLWKELFLLKYLKI